MSYLVYDVVWTVVKALCVSTAGRTNYYNVVHMGVYCNAVLLFALLVCFRSTFLFVVLFLSSVLPLDWQVSVFLYISIHTNGIKKQHKFLN